MFFSPNFANLSKCCIVYLISLFLYSYFQTEILQEILDAFVTPENKTRMDEVKDAAGNDMMKMMQIVFPVATQIQMEVIQKYGFSADGEGGSLHYFDGDKVQADKEKT